VSPPSQGVALGYRMPPRWGFRQALKGRNIVTTQQSQKKDLDSDSAGLRRYDERGKSLPRYVIPAKAGIQCWRMIMHLMC
jgi:hypothetical protein